MSDFGQCVNCPEGGNAALIAAVIALALVYLVGVYAYIRLLERFPDYKGWIATLSIVMADLQLVSVVGVLSTLEGSVVHKIAKIASAAFIDLAIAQPGCLFPQEPVKIFDFVLTASYVPLIVWGLLPALTFIMLGLYKTCLWYGNEGKGEGTYEGMPSYLEQWDRIENLTIVMFSQLWPTMLTAAIDMAMMGGVWVNYAVFMLLGLALFLRKMLMDLSSLQAHSTEWDRGSCVFGSWQWDANWMCSSPVFCCLCPLDKCLGPVSMVERPGAMPEAMRERVETRTLFLSGKFSSRTPYWQFLLWGRQLVMILSERFIGDEFMQSGLLLVELSLSLALQRYFRPYDSPAQNWLEEGIIASNAALTTLGMIYFGIASSAGGDLAPAVAGGFDAVFVTLLILPPLLFFACVVRKRGHLPTFRLSVSGDVDVGPRNGGETDVTTGGKRRAQHYLQSAAI